MSRHYTQEQRKRWSKTYKEKHPERVKLFAVQYREKNKPKIKEYNRQYWKKWYQKNRVKRHIYQTTGLGQKKSLARAKVRIAIIKGKIKKGNCSITDCNKIGEAHHVDYDKPLEILWLCSSHHKNIHTLKN